MIKNPYKKIVHALTGYFFYGKISPFHSTFQVSASGPHIWYCKITTKSTYSTCSFS